MQTVANTNRVLTGYSSSLGLADSEIVVSHGGLLQHILTRHFSRNVHSQQLFVQLTIELVRFAEHAYSWRDLNSLEQVSRILMGLPVDAARQIGLYYYAINIKRRGRINEAQRLLETVADNAPPTYKARAIQGLGAVQHDLGHLDEALRFQLEALRMASDRNAHELQTALMARWEISLLRYLDGDHRGALSDLESLSPLVNLLAKQEPFHLYGYCNDLAVVLGDLGRIAEAEATLEVALRSPYAPAYPNWAETRQELEAKRTSATPSVVAVTQTPEVIPAPRMQPQPCLVRPQPSQIRKRVFAFCWLSSRGTFHRLVAIAGFIAIANCQTTRNTLDQLGRCIRSRAPPASTLNESENNNN
jgi:tetratricopeptide (TPR) repeat protein